MDDTLIFVCMWHMFLCLKKVKCKKGGFQNTLQGDKSVILINEFSLDFIHQF